MGARLAKVSMSALIRAVRPFVENRPSSKTALKAIHLAATQAHHDLAQYFPRLIVPQPRQLTISLTSHCNFRCRGCLYGRGFKEGAQLPRPVVESMLADAQEAGIESVRYYGGEPLLHPDLQHFIAATRSVGMRPYVTTNGILLGRKIEALSEAGLTTVTIGFYGSAEHYDGYTQRADQRAKLEASLATVRNRLGDRIELQLNLVLLKTCTSVPAVRDAWSLAKRFGMYLHVDLASYSVPFFNNDESLGLQFDESDRPLLVDVASELIGLKIAAPSMVLHSEEFLRSIPDWLTKKADLRIPCDAYEMVWVGPDGSVQLCDTSFTLGNLHETPLSEILFSATHVKSCRDAFALNCPNCICRADSRVQRSRSARRAYRA